MITVVVLIVYYLSSGCVTVMDIDNAISTATSVRLWSQDGDDDVAGGVNCSVV